MSKTHATVEYDSNPFTLSFRALGVFFNINVAWPVVLICMEALNSIWQLFGTIADIAKNSNPASISFGSIVPEITGQSVNGLGVGAAIVVILLVFIVALCVAALAIAFGTYFNGMYAYAATKSLEGRKVGFAEAFDATTRRFWRLLFAGFLAGLKTFGWLLLFIIPCIFVITLAIIAGSAFGFLLVLILPCLIPGIRAGLRYSILPYVIMSDSGNIKGVLESHNRTKTIVKGRLMEIFGVATVSAVVPFVNTSLSIIGSAALHRQFAHYHDHKLEKPGIHWLNYIGIILLAGLILFIGLIGLIVLAFSTAP